MQIDASQASLLLLGEHSCFGPIHDQWWLLGPANRPSEFIAQTKPAAPVAVPAATGSKLALLVGCTKYIYRDNISPLNGPRNDVPAMARLLVGSFGLSRGGHSQALRLARS